MDFFYHMLFTFALVGILGVVAGILLCAFKCYIKYRETKQIKFMVLSILILIILFALMGATRFYVKSLF